MIGRFVETGSTGAGIGAALRMTMGIVGSGRADATGRGATLGIGIALGSDATLGSGTVLVMGAATEGTGTVGTPSGEAIAGRVGTGTSVGAASGAARDEVHAAHAISAKRTSERIANLPTRESSKSPASRPRAQRKQVVVAVQSASAGLTGARAVPSLVSMRVALAASMAMARISGSISRSGG